MAAGRRARFWRHVLDLGLTLWVLRAVVVAVLFGFAILGLAPQAQDLLVDVAAGPWWYTLLFLLSVFFVWAMPTHYAARLLVETDTRYLRQVRQRGPGFLGGLKKHAPRVLGLLSFAAMLVGVLRSWSNVPTVEAADVTGDARSSLIRLSIYLVLSALAFWAYTIFRQRLARLPFILAFNAGIGACVAWWATLPWLLSAPAAHLGSRTGNLGPLYLILMFLVCAFLPFVLPVVFAEQFPRAIAVPFVIAGWTPLAAYASSLGRRWRVPIISFALLGAAVLTYVLGDNYSVRLINAEKHVGTIVEVQSHQPSGYALATYKPPGGIETRIKLHDAVQLWTRANGCEVNRATCPRPIIIAASGGASRAGFFTASVIGKLIDGGSGIPSGVARKRVFAISSVSGSSVGAVISVAALAASADKQPCQTDAFYLYYAIYATNWQSCLEQLMSGDFLTPVFAGLVFRDTLRFLGGLGWPDRASLIEQSWERHFRRRIVEQEKPSPRCLRNLDCPFLTLRPQETGGEVAWLPLLLLNGTSVSTGQRIVTSTVDPWYRPRRGQCPRDLDENNPEECPVLDHAFDFHWLISGGKEEQPQTDATKPVPEPAPEPAKPDLESLNDIRLSTAAHNSARFPLISPPGEVRNQANSVVDRIVDGGYFENFGAQTALEVATAIRAVDPALVPFVIIISNDPEIPTETLKTPDDAEGEFLTDLSAPAKTIMNTRAARGTLAVDAVATVLGDDLSERCAPNAAQIRVWPEYESGKKVRPLSFSWWLSKPVQTRLREQTQFVDPNQADNQQALRVIASALGSKPQGCTGKIQVAPAPRKYEGLRPRR